MDADWPEAMADSRDCRSAGRARRRLAGCRHRRPIVRTLEARAVERGRPSQFTRRDAHADGAIFRVSSTRSATGSGIWIDDGNRNRSPPIAPSRFAVVMTDTLFSPPSPCPNVNVNRGESLVAQRLHLVFGGELTNPSGNVDDIETAGIFPDHQSAYDAWKRMARRTVDDARVRYSVAPLHRSIDVETESSPTEELER